MDRRRSPRKGRSPKRDRIELRRLILLHLDKPVEEIAQIPEIRTILVRLCPLTEAADRWYCAQIRSIIQEVQLPDGTRLLFSVSQQVLEGFSPEEVASIQPAPKGMAAQSVIDAENDVYGVGEDEVGEDEVERRRYVREAEILGNAAAYRDILNELRKRVMGNIWRCGILRESTRLAMIQGLSEQLDQEYEHLVKAMAV